MKYAFFATLLVFSSAVFAKTYEVEVTGMHCGNCSDRMKKAVLKNLVGVKTVNANYETGLVTIEADDSTNFSDKDIKSAVKDLGPDYKVQKVITK